MNDIGNFTEFMSELHIFSMIRHSRDHRLLTVFIAGVEKVFLPLELFNIAQNEIYILFHLMIVCHYVLVFHRKITFNTFMFVRKTFQNVEQFEGYKCFQLTAFFAGCNIFKTV